MNDNDNLRRVTFDRREYSVVFVDLFAGGYSEICLMDAATEKFTHCCTEPMAGVPLIARQALVRDEFVGLLADAGIVEPTGEFIETERTDRLHTCDVPVRELVPFWEQGRTPAAVSESNRPETIEHDVPERDLNDEIEL